MTTLLAASFERMGDLSNKLHLVDKKNTKSNIWKYFSLRFNVIFISESLLLNQRFVISMPNYNLKTRCTVITVIPKHDAGNILKLIFFTLPSTTCICMEQALLLLKC